MRPSRSQILCMGEPQIASAGLVEQSNALALVYAGKSCCGAE